MIRPTDTAPIVGQGSPRSTSTASESPTTTDLPRDTRDPVATTPLVNTDELVAPKADPRIKSTAPAQAGALPSLYGEPPAHAPVDFELVAVAASLGILNCVATPTVPDGLVPALTELRIECMARELIPTTTPDVHAVARKPLDALLVEA